MLLGRSGECDVVLADRKVSSRHAEICRVGPHWVLRDLGSTNGTFVNGRRVTETVLALGDEITLGLTQLLFTDRTKYEKTARLIVGDDEPAHVVRFALADIEQRLFGDLQRKAAPDLSQRLQVIYRLGSTLNNVLDVEELVERVMDLVVETVACDRAYLFLCRAGKLVPKAIRKRDGLEEEQGLRVSATLLAQVLEEGKALFTRDACQDDRFRGGDSIHRFSIRSALAVPLRVQDKVLGVVYVDRVTTYRAYQEDDLHLLVMICNHAASNLATAQLFEELRVANLQLRKAKEEILRWNVELESKVEQRTQEIAAQAARITQLSEQKDELLGMVAHDLRTPLTSILGYLEMIDQQLEMGIPAARLREDVGVVVRIASEMAELLNDLLDVSRIEAGRVRIEPRLAPLEPLLEECRRTYAALAASRQLTLSLLTEALPPVRHDRRRIAQVLNNLLHNAVKFSEPGGRIEIRAARLAGEVHISVSDTGPGLEPGEAEAVFGRYVQGAGSARAPASGAGLGLAIARKLVELHGGRIWAESVPGCGARFTFTLPLH
ncbi:MAG: hypothetical protein KatS3mg102_0882 [Planctomycetota bacterium]|nr:MAG: hypothetical protein KatS3mg102_0882 [Planctomycetota bacterium]